MTNVLHSNDAPVLPDLQGHTVAFVDTDDARVVLGANYLPLGNTLDAVRFVGDFEVSYRFFTLHVNAGTATKPAPGGIAWQIGAYAGLRAAW